MHHVTPDHDKCSKQKGQPCLYKTVISWFQNMIDKKNKTVNKSITVNIQETED